MPTNAPTTTTTHSRELAGTREWTKSTMCYSTDRRLNLFREGAKNILFAAIVNTVQRGYRVLESKFLMQSETLDTRTQTRS